MVAIRVGHEWTQICEKCRPAFGVMNHFHKIISNFHMHRCVQNRRFFLGGFVGEFENVCHPVPPATFHSKCLTPPQAEHSPSYYEPAEYYSPVPKSRAWWIIFFIICALALPGLQKKCDSIWVAPTPSHRGLCNFTRDKTGFKPRIGTEPVLATFECICGKSLGWNASVWFASFGIPKACDRVEYDPAVGSTNADRILFLAFGFVSTPARCTWSWAFIFNAAWGEANWCHQFLFLILLIVLTMVQYG